ncbi:BURP domain-containing protein 3 [Vitis vinifera]|uniref:BURP domain-containing protein 3 n=1 Tax=Vitis vinifera TaxID=29760 RepID=A0A438FPQ3_VITVI|nr:BURP domain-containing protein 3 [Vitis vinifera]
MRLASFLSQLQTVPNGVFGIKYFNVASDPSQLWAWEYEAKPTSSNPQKVEKHGLLPPPPLSQLDECSHSILFPFWLFFRHASLPSEGYWKLVLSHTPMPKAVKDHLQPGVTSFNASAARCFGIHNQFNKIPQPFHAKQAQDGLNIGNFFLQTDLHPGTKMMLQLPQSTNEGMFLPCQVADSISFSSKKLPKILNRLSVKEKSAEAELMKKEIEELVTSKLGRNVNVLTNEVKTGSQEYEFGVGMKKVADKSVVCHKMNYPYAVFYCHTFTKTRTYMIPLVGADGSKAKAMAACHSDTSAWHPQHVAFQVLKIKPGTVAVYHFLHNNAMVWIPKFED